MMLAEAEIKAEALGFAQRWLRVLEVPLLCAAHCGQGLIGVLDLVETLPLLHGVRESLEMELRWVCTVCSRGDAACPPDACERGPAAAPALCRAQDTALCLAKGTLTGSPSFRLHGGAAEAPLEVSMSRRCIPTLKPTQCIAGRRGQRR